MAPTEPTQLLLQSNKADTMPIRSRDGEKIGTLYALMVNKRSGQAVYAVLTIGGFMGLGRAYYPIPFALLHFDAVADTYVVTIDRRVLEGGPSWAANAPNFDQAYADRVSKYYDIDGRRFDGWLGGETLGVRHDKIAVPWPFSAALSASSDLDSRSLQAQDKTLADRGRNSATNSQVYALHRTGRNIACDDRHHTFRIADFRSIASRAGRSRQLFGLEIIRRDQHLPRMLVGRAISLGLRCLL